MVHPLRFLGALQDLLEWVRQHNRTTQVTLDVVQQTQGSPDNHPKYWWVIFSFLYQGQTAVVRKLLELHSGYQDDRNNPFEVVRHLLYKMPVLSPDSSSTQFFRVWSQWQNTCRQLLEDFDMFPELHGVLRLLSGDVNFLEEKASR